MSIRRRLLELELHQVERDETELRAQLAGYELAIAWLEADRDEPGFVRAVQLAVHAEDELADLATHRARIDARIAELDRRASESIFATAGSQRSAT